MFCTIKSMCAAINGLFENNEHGWRNDLPAQVDSRPWRLLQQSRPRPWGWLPSCYGNRRWRYLHAAHATCSIPSSEHSLGPWLYTLAIIYKIKEPPIVSRLLRSCIAYVLVAWKARHERFLESAIMAIFPAFGCSKMQNIGNNWIFFKFQIQRKVQRSVSIASQH